MRLLIKKLNEKAALPQRQTPCSAGYDLCACLDETITVKSGRTVKIPTGISAELEGEKNAVLLIYARSSLALNFGLAPANCVGVVDQDYRGEIIVAIHNHSQIDHTIRDGERIAQMVITPVLLPEVEEVAELSDTERGSGGFGSTGR